MFLLDNVCRGNRESINYSDFVIIVLRGNDLNSIDKVEKKIMVTVLVCFFASNFLFSFAVLLHSSGVLCHIYCSFIVEM